MAGALSDLWSLPVDPKPTSAYYPYSIKCYKGCTLEEMESNTCTGTDGTATSYTPTQPTIFYQTSGVPVIVDSSTNVVTKFASSMYGTSQATTTDSTRFCANGGEPTGTSNTALPTTGNTLPFFYVQQSDDDDVCFDSLSSHLTLKNGKVVSMKNIKIGEEILTFDQKTKLFQYSPVIFPTHKLSPIKRGSDVVLTTLKLQHAQDASDEITISLTPKHLMAVLPLADDSGRCHDGLLRERNDNNVMLIAASDVKVGMCLVSATTASQSDPRVQFSPRVVSVTSTSTGTADVSRHLMTVVVKDAHLLPVVNGIVASSFAYDQRLPNLFYNFHRLLYNIGMKSYVDEGSALYHFTDRIGRQAAKAATLFW